MMDEKMTNERLLEICDKLMAAMAKENISPPEVGKAVYALFITGCVNARLSDPSIDRVLAKIKKEIQRQRNGKRK